MAVIGFTETVDVDRDHTVHLVPAFYAMTLVQYELNEIVQSTSALVQPLGLQQKLFFQRSRG
ncbi:hypothetical protein COMA1_11311 [Candidatus Nitrospira nitrosa]|uniref:Uncharacterized protein n=1 Tax=Candidatus Nitrospira nitrosa TaxID=1742972 RepID=A0A0S4LAR6_9BACT|nr:hypothetical protein COMA1_11311 [Candidatus Nitrospira nitrosa]